MYKLFISNGCSKYAIALISLLIVFESSFAGVTISGVTAYRFEADKSAIFFTDNQADDPNGTTGPLGVGAYDPGLGCASSQASAGIAGLVCIGPPGSELSTFVCSVTNLVQSDTGWCLFSNSPQLGQYAWAVKYENGVIPTNDDESIVLCRPVDTFSPVTGCTFKKTSLLPTQISLEDGYIKLDTTTGTAPPIEDCTIPPHWGRLVIDKLDDLIYICTKSGWVSK